MIRPLTVAGAAAAALIAVATPSYAVGGVTATVSAGKTGLTVRAAGTSASAALGTLRNGSRVSIACQVSGPRLSGRVRTTTQWDRLSDGRYVSDAYLRRSRAVPACPPPPPASPPAVILVPPTGAVPIGTWVAPVSGRGSSGFRIPSRPEHDGVDIMQARNTPIHATAAGTVITVVCNTNGLTCDVDGDPVLTRGCGWYVEIRHSGDVVTRYCHLIRLPEVVVGQQVTADQVIGFVGSSGHSSGPHLHFEVHFGVGQATRANAIDPAAFMRSAGAPIV